MLVYPMRRPTTKLGELDNLEKRRVARAEAMIYQDLMAASTAPAGPAGGPPPPPPLNEEAPGSRGKKPRGRKPVIPAPILVPFTTDPDLWDALWDHDLRVERWVDVIKVMANRVRGGGGTVDQRRVLKAQIARLNDIVA